MGEHHSGPAVVDVWTVEPTVRPPGRRLDALDDDERRRAGALTAVPAARFVLARALLRTVLAQRLGRPPDRVVLEARCAVCGGRHGPVRLVGVGAADEPTWHLSVTRAGPLVAVALSGSGPVGVDVESVDAVGAAPLAAVALTPAEQDRLAGLPPTERGNALAATWVRKEAVLKALGTGLRQDPAGIELHPGGDRVRGRADIALADLELGPGRVGAVAVRSHAAAGGVAVRRHDGAAALAAHR